MTTGTNPQYQMLYRSSGSSWSRAVAAPGGSVSPSRGEWTVVVDQSLHQHGQPWP